MGRTKRNRFGFAFILLSLTATAFAQSAGSVKSESQPPAPHLEFVFEEFVTLGANIHPGVTPFGERNIVPITGGDFSGPKIHGKVMSGGWDWQLTTKSGCHSLSANYMIQANDGAIINVMNKGTLCDSAGPTAKLFTVPTFEAPLGPHDWLNSGAFIGTLEAASSNGKPAVHIRFYEVK
jgi:hypothetical protein